MKVENKCWLWWFHDWSKWEDSFQVHLLDDLTRLPIGQVVVQKRRCSKCGKMQARRVKL